MRDKLIELFSVHGKCGHIHAHVPGIPRQHIMVPPSHVVGLAYTAPKERFVVLPLTHPGDLGPDVRSDSDNATGAAYWSPSAHGFEQFSQSSGASPGHLSNAYMKSMKFFSDFGREHEDGLGADNQCQGPGSQGSIELLERAVVHAFAAAPPNGLV